MARKLSSPISLISKEKLILLIEKCNSIGEVLRYLGLRNHGSNQTTFVKRCIRDNIDYSKFQTNFGIGGLKPSRVAIEQRLIQGYRGNRTHLKHHLIRLGILKEECKVCGLGPVWQNKRLVLIIDHINGIHDDYRLENLRLLCPNCNSQTDTFAGKNRAYKVSAISAIV